MANRHLARSTVLQSLYELDFRNKSDLEAGEIITRNAKEFAGEELDLSFMKILLINILEKQKDIDNIITKAAPDWPIEKISIVDRNILRIGLFELLFSDKGEVPAKVAINEAIELAKSYGGEKSSKFVNGVLGSVYREMGEPGKDEVSKKKNKTVDVPFEKMQIERLGGVVIFSKEGEESYVVLVHDVFGYWTLPKGHIGENESETEGAERAVSEEIGIPIKIIEELGNNEYIASHPENGKTRKQVKYYLAEAKFSPVKLSKIGGLDAVKWFNVKEITDLNFYNDILPILAKAIKFLVDGEKTTIKV